MSPEEERLNGLLDAQAPKPEDVLTAEDKFYRMIIRAIATTVISVVAIVGGCTAHSNTYDAERLSEEAKIVVEKSKVSIAESQAKRAIIETMESMVKDGVNPIAVRCMVKGWNKDAGTCMAVGLALGKKLPKE